MNGLYPATIEELIHEIWCNIIHRRGACRLIFTTEDEDQA